MTRLPEAGERIAELSRPRSRGARLLGPRRTRSAPASHQRDGAEEYVFYDGPAVRERPAALRPPADRVRQGHRPALPDHARLQGRAAVRLGHPRTARRTRGAAPTRHHREGADRGDGHRRVQRGLPCLGHEVLGGVARLRHAAGPVGRLRRRLQDARPQLHGVRALGLQAALGQGPGLRGQSRPALLLERRDPAVQPRAADGRRRLPEPAGPGADRRVQGDRGGARRCVPAGVDDHAVDAAVQPGRRGQPRRDLRRRSRVPTAGGTSSPRPGWRPTRANSGRSRRCSAPTGAASCSVSTYLPPFPYFMDSPNAFRVLPGDFVTTEDGTGIVHMAPAYGEDDKATADAADIVAVTPVDSKGRFDRDRARLRGPARLRRQPADHPRSEEPVGASRGQRRRSSCATRPTTTPTRTAGGAETR